MSTKEKINSKTDIKSFEARLKQLEKNYHEKNSEITKLTYQSASNQSEINLLLKEFEDDNTLQTIDQLFSEKSNIKSKRSEHSCVSEELIHYDINNHNNPGFKIKNNTNIKTSSMPKINKNKINEGFKIDSSINNNPSISLGSNKSIENINKNKKQSINKNSNKSNINNYIYNINIINSNNGEQNINRNQRNISKKRSASNSQDSNIKNNSYKEKENEIQMKQKDNYQNKSSSINENTLVELNKKDITKKSNLKSFSQSESSNEYENNIKINSNKNRKIEIKEDSVDQKTNNERILKKNKETLKEMFDLESFGNNDSKSKSKSKNKQSNEILDDKEIKDILINNKISNNLKSDNKNIGMDNNSNKAIIKDSNSMVDKKDTNKIVAIKNEKFVNNKKSDVSMNNTQNLLRENQNYENKNDNYSKTISNSKQNNNNNELNLNPNQNQSQTINQNQTQNNKNNVKLGIGFGSKITNFNNSKKNNMFTENKIEINKVTNIKKIKALKNNSDIADKQSNGFQSQTYRSSKNSANDQISGVKKNNTIETKGNVDKRNSAFKNKVKSKASENIKKLDNSFKEINPKNNIDLIFREVNTRSNSVINIPDNKNYDAENLKKNSTFYNKDSFTKQNYLNELDQLVSSSAKVEVQSKNSNSKLIGLDKPDDMIRIHRANTNIYNSSLLNEIKTNYRHLKNVMKSDTKANKISVILSNNNVVPLKLRSILILNSKKAYRYTDLSSFFEEIVSNTNKRLLSIKDQLSTYKMNIDVINQVEKGYVPCKTIQAFLNLITKEDEQDFKDESQLNSPNDLLSEIIIALITKNEKKFPSNVEKVSVSTTTNNTVNNKLLIIPKNNLDLLNSPQYKGKKTYTQALYKIMSQMKIFKLKDLLFEKLNGDIFINKQIHNLLIEYIENNPDIFDMSLETLRGLNKVSKILVYFIHDLMKFIERKCSDGTYLYNLRLLMLEESYFKIKMKKLKKYYSQF